MERDLAALLAATFRFNNISIEDGYTEADKVMLVACFLTRPYRTVSPFLNLHLFFESLEPASNII